MYVIPVFMIIVGIVFLIINLLIFMRTYARMAHEKGIRWNSLCLNLIGSISSFVLFLLGVMYLIIINQQI